MMEYLSEIINELSQALNSLDLEMFQLLVDESATTLKNGGRIIVSGLGKNVAICEKFVGTMISMGLDAYFLHTNSAIHGDLGVIREKDLIILLSKSGKTVETIYLAKNLEKRNVNMWTLTFEKASPLINIVNHAIILTLNHEGDLWNIVPNNSTTLNLIVLQSLAIHIAKKLNVQLEDFKRNHPGGYIGELLRGEDNEI